MAIGTCFKSQIMKVLNTTQIRAADAYTIQNEPILSINLMERAASKCAEWICGRFPNNRPVKIFVGSGNNGGDGWAVARMLNEKGFEVSVYSVKISDKISRDASTNKERLEVLGKVHIREVSAANELPQINNNDLVIDALFGTGLTRPLDGFAAEVVNYLNAFSNVLIAIDIPSGLFGESNFAEGDKKVKNIARNIIKANYTLTFQFPKLSFFFAENEKYVGDWHVLPIGLHEEFLENVKTPYYFIDESFIKPLVKKRKRFSHKGSFGHAYLIAGSYGMMGAAVLAAKACLKSGVGLITTHIPHYGYNVMQAAVPENMVCIDESDYIFTGFPDLSPYNAIGIGPGIGQKSNTCKALLALLETYNKPMVLDADALNIIGEKRELLGKIPKHSIITPHPKEFERLFGETDDHHSRMELQIEKSKELGIYIVLKGANTLITTPEGDCYFNSTGNPGMATAGSGDALTGIILSLLAQGYGSKEAALLGVFVHGRAGDIAMSEMGEEAITASDIIEHFGAAFLSLKD